jgi:hypothetical protein
MIELRGAHGTGIESFVASRPTKPQRNATIASDEEHYEFSWGYIRESAEEVDRVWLLVTLDSGSQEPGVEALGNLWGNCAKWMPAAINSLPLRNMASGEFARCTMGKEFHSYALRLEFAAQVLARFEDQLRSRMYESAEKTQSYLKQFTQP